MPSDLYSDAHIPSLERDRLKKKFSKSRDPADWENYWQKRNKVVTVRRKAVQLHFRKLCDEKRNNQRKFWATIKPYIDSRKGSKNNSRIVLDENDKTITDPHAVAETLNEYFSNITRKDTTNQRKATPNISHIANHIGNVPTLSLKKTNHWEVKDILPSTKVNTATGYDFIPLHVLKQSTDVLCAILLAL